MSIARPAASTSMVAILGLWSFSHAWGSLMLLAVLAAIGMLLVVFAPSVMPNTKLPGSKGSLMLLTGGIAAVIWALTALSYLGWIFGHLATFDVLHSSWGSSPRWAWAGSAGRHSRLRAASCRWAAPRPE
jgi:hypothetical protein